MSPMPHSADLKVEARLELLGHVSCEESELVERPETEVEAGAKCLNGRVTAGSEPRRGTSIWMPVDSRYNLLGLFCIQNRGQTGCSRYHLETTFP